ncbi:MAG: gfo/Idh/MocA family oxidoreductase, partial [Pseudomonadales bacterium]
VQQSSYQIGGSHGSLSVPDMTLWKNPSKRSWWEPLVSSNPHIPSSDPIANQLIHFREVILGNEEPLVSAAEGLKSLRVIEALQQSAKDQRTIYLN